MLSCSALPEGQARWSLRRLADRLVELELIDTVSHETMRRALRKNEIKSCRKVGSVIAPQASTALVAAMEKVLDIYLQPALRREASGAVHGRDAPAIDSRDPRACCSGARPA